MTPDMTCAIVTPEGIVRETQVTSVTLMTTTGEITILPGHIPLVSELKAGTVTLRTASGAEDVVVSTGCVEVRPGNRVVILTDAAGRSEALDAARIEEAKRQAQKIMAETKTIDEEQFARAAAALEHELAKERVLLKKKYRDVGKRFGGE